MKKRKIFLAITIIAITALFASFALAQETNQTVDQVLMAIKQAQNVTQDQDIDCAKVTADQFAILGDAVMSIMHPDETQHEFMDQMMGGEGSQSLENMHISMGQQYLGCYNNTNGANTDLRGMGCMMGSTAGCGMMGSNVGGCDFMSNNYNYKDNQRFGFDHDYMMGNWGYGVGVWFCIILGALGFVLIVLGIAALIKYLFNSQESKK